jgi:hypothetical protein
MAATVLIRRLTGAGPTATDITSINTRANAYDGHSTADTTYPIQIPVAGTNYSFWVVTRLDCTVTPSSIINNLKWYTDGANGFGTGVTMKVNTATGYVQATGTQGTTGDQLTVGNYATLAGAPGDAFSYTSGSPLSVTGSISNPSTGQFGDRVVYQIEVASTASPGATPTETITWKYDEV